MEKPSQYFIDLCLDIATQKAQRGSLISPTPTLGASPIFETEDVPEDIPEYPGAFSDFRGLPSNPVCVYRTGHEWPQVVSTGPCDWSQSVLREARPICNHPIQKVWFTLGKQIYEYLDSKKVK